jgi:hypothetical protein
MRQRPGERRCCCGHDKTLHAWPERRSDGLGACHGQGFALTEAGAVAVCSCARFVTPGQRRMTEWRKRHAEAVREARADYARRELSEAQVRKDSQEG